ncbi:MAG: hypothetical protein EPN93_17385 [Spirochaetes bacterium]|nr:MAG: hypothetical protein EPN93_17385 [Spirochaetota bacterium]
MKEYIKNWIRFFHDSKDNPDNLYALFEYISHFNAGAFLTFNDVKNNIRGGDIPVASIIKSLISTGLLSEDSKCPDCGSSFDFPYENPIPDVLECSHCHSDIPVKRISFLQVTDQASYKSLIVKKLEDESYELNAELLSQIGRSQEYLIFVISDIEGSELLQKSDNEIYNAHLGYLWQMWPRLFRFSSRVYLPILARGDAVSAVFSDMNDAISVILRIPEELKKRESLRLKIYVELIPFSAHDRKGFQRSLDRRWDLNTPAVTDTFRISGGIKPKNWENAPPHCVKLVFLNNAMSSVKGDQRFSNFIAEKYSFKSKHEVITYEGQFLAGVL